MRGFPSETLVFPGHSNCLDNLLFCKTFDPKNMLIKMKLSIIEEKKLDPKSLLPTSLLEEKLYNPFLRTGDSYI